ncbi:MAG: FecR domain-containing protein [Ignavibacterium sp.]|nr:MAG: FecR domain-containing protein [Ignavibacterium sp.]
MEQDNKYIRSLIDNARCGKIGALEELYEMCLDDIFTLIIRLTGDKKLAEQFTIDTLVSAWKEINKKIPEQISFANWIRNVAIKTTICGLIGPKDCREKMIKKKAAYDVQGESFSTDPLEKAIADLDDESRAIFVLNKIDGKPLATFSGFLGVKKSDAETKLSESVLSISNSLPNVESEAGLDTLVESLSNQIEPDENLIESALSEINEIRIKQLKEEDANSAELKELIALEKKRKKALKKNYKKVKEVYKKEKALKSSDKMIIAILLLTSLVSFILFLSTSTNAWNLSSVSGKPLKNKASMDSMEEILPGDVISTNEVSTAAIDISDVGRINILSNTSVTRLEEDNWAELNKGKLKFNTAEAKDNFNIAIPNATIQNIEFGTRYTVDVDPNGNSKIVLEKGWLRVISAGDDIIFPQKYNLKILNESGASLPYYSESSSVLVSRFEDYLFNGKENAALNSILESSTEKEAIILWNLLPRVKQDQRNAVYEKLYELVPHRDDISRDEMLSLEKKYLKTWLDEIKWYL